MGQGGGVARVLELARHLGVGEDLARVQAPQLEQAAQQGGLVHPRPQQHVPGDGRLDQGVEYVACPTFGLGPQRRRSRIGAEEQVLVQGPSEGVTHLGEAPVGEAQDLEAPGQALGEAPLDQQRRRGHQHDLQGCFVAGVGVPEAFHGLGPAVDLVDLVERQQRADAVRRSGQQPGRLPLLDDPLAPPQARLVGAGVASRRAQSIHRLPDQRRLSHLPGPGNHLDEAPGLPQAVEERHPGRPDI